MTHWPGIRDNDHTTCPPGSHTFDAGTEFYEGRVDEHGHTLCNDCGALMFYCTRDEWYHHAGEGGGGCFLIGEGAHPVPLPRPWHPGRHDYDPGRDWACRAHPGQDCPPFDTSLLENPRFANV